MRDSKTCVRAECIQARIRLLGVGVFVVLYMLTAWR